MKPSDEECWATFGQMNPDEDLTTPEEVAVLREFAEAYRSENPMPAHFRLVGSLGLPFFPRRFTATQQVTRGCTRRGWIELFGSFLMVPASGILGPNGISWCGPIFEEGFELCK
jgi:hypothetical protein